MKFSGKGGTVMHADTVVTQLARFCCGLRFEDLDEAVVDKAKQLTLDQLGVEIACSVLPWNQGLCDYVRMLDSRGNCTVVGYGLKTNVEYAVLANATFGHGFEIDDFNSRATVGHPASVTVPVAIALAETRPTSGKRMIEALVSGYEVMSAIARGIQPSSHFGRGFHAQSSGGPFASAAVAGVLLQQDVPTLAQAFSLAASHAGGIMEYTNTGGNVKRLHAGMAASGGVRSALLAQRGWAGPPTAIEGQRGFCAAFADEYNIEAITEELGKNYWILYMALKPYSCNANIVAPIDALKAVLAETPITPEEVADIEVHLRSRGQKSVGGIGPEPPDIVGAQFSLHFSLAMTLVKGSNDFNTLLTVDLKDPELINVARKVRIVPDKRADEEEASGQRWGRVIVTTRDGRRLDKSQYAKGSLRNPMSQQEVEAKFQRLASSVLESRKVDKIVDLCRHLEDVEDVSQIAQWAKKS